jgi:8-oxo-dGTP pyrophosphatase MutT (NUDIX family)
VELSWSLLLGLLACVAAAAYWHDTLGARERANDAVRELCEETGVSLLDGTVAFARLRVVRGDAGRPALERSYVFDYSDDGYTRRQGYVVLRGRQVESVVLG